MRSDSLRKAKRLRFSSCAIDREVVESDHDAVCKRAPRRIPLALPRAVVAEPSLRIVVDSILPPVIAKARIEVKGRLGLGVGPRGDLKQHLIEPARLWAPQVSEETDVAVRRLKRRNPGKAPSHDLAFHRPSPGIEHFASPSFFRFFVTSMQDEGASSFVPHAVVVFGKLAVGISTWILGRQGPACSPATAST